MSKLKYSQFILVLLFGIANAANIALVPKTGQTSTLPLVASTGADGDLQKGASWPVPRFILDTSRECIIDQLTGLMWLKDPSQLTSSGSTDMTWADGLTTADSGSWCGYTDWRLPNVNELKSLMNYAYRPSDWLMYGSGNQATPVCDGVCFSNMTNNYYWTSSTDAANTDNAWLIDMNLGITSRMDKEDTYPIMVVRGGR